MARVVTFAWMCHTDGTTATYLVSRGILHYRKGRADHFGLDDPRTVDVGVITRTDHCIDRWGAGLSAYYLEMARRFETPNAPAFAF